MIKALFILAEFAVRAKKDNLIPVTAGKAKLLGFGNVGPAYLFTQSIQL